MRSDQYIFYEIQFDRELTPLQNFTPDYTFDPSSYVVTPAIDAIHNFPRFGNPNDFTDLINTVGSGDSDATSEAARQYAVGIFAGSILILSIAVLWFFVIAMLKIAGRSKVGFFAGRLVRPVSQGSNDAGVEIVMDNEAAAGAHLAHDDHANKSFVRRVIFVRLVFIVCGMLTIIASILFYTKGVAAFKDSIEAMNRGIELIQDVAYGAINVTENVISAENQLSNEVDPLIAAENAGEPFCRVTDDDLSNQIRETWSLLVTSVQELTDLVSDNLNLVSEDLQTVIDLTEDVKNTLTVADVVFWILIVVSIFIVSFIAVMLGAVALAIAGISNGCTKCITAAVIWPIFTLLLILSWILSTVFLIASLAGADFCIDPDAYVLQTVDQYQGEFQSTIFAFLLFYISGCTERPSGEAVLFTIIDSARQVNTYAHAFAEMVGNINPATIAAICGVDATQAQAIQQVSTFLHNISHLINKSMIGLMDLISCKSFNPIYTTFVYDALCSGGVQGLSWIFFTMLTIALSSMMMITFRAALYPVREEAGALAKAADVDVVQYQQHMHDAQDVGDLHLRETNDADEVAKQQSRNEAEQEPLEADKAVQIY